jgi:hypothetical protein
VALLQSNFASTVTAPVNFVLMEELLSAARKRLPYFNGTLPGKLEKMQGAASVKWRRIENLAAVTTACRKTRRHDPGIWLSVARRFARRLPTSR